jgi:hypothetical protein
VTTVLTAGRLRTSDACILSLPCQYYCRLRLELEQSSSEGKGTSGGIAMKLPEDVYRCHAVTMVSRETNLSRTSFWTNYLLVT